MADADLPEGYRWLLGNQVETYLQLRGREASEYDRLRDRTVNREVKAMEMTWAERVEAEYTRKGLAQGIEALRGVVLRQRFGSVPKSAQSKVESIDEMGLG